MNTHTKGPWGTFQDTDGTNVVYCNGDSIQRHVCYTSEGGVSDDEAEANARLIAAAPELLEALKIAQLWLDVDGRYDMQGINAAIAKATGAQ